MMCCQDLFSREEVERGGESFYLHPNTCFPSYRESVSGWRRGERKEERVRENR